MPVSATVDFYDKGVCDGTADLKVTQWNFPAGEAGITVGLRDLGGHKHRFTVSIAYESDSDLFAGGALVEYLSSYGEVDLVIPYMPYSRQDREIADNGTPNMLRHISKYINSLPHKTLTVFTPHSYGVECALDHRTVFGDIPLSLALPSLRRYNSGFYKEILHPNRDIIVVAPDAGAVKRASKDSTYPLAFGIKQRSLNGDIGSLKIFSEIETPAHLNRTVVVYDDLCDGGATFIKLAEALEADPRFKGCPRVLVVTHGIYSKGIDILLEQYVAIYTGYLVGKGWLTNQVLGNVSLAKEREPFNWRVKA